MINKDGGGGNFRFYGGDTELMGGPPVPPTRENPALSNLSMFPYTKSVNPLSI